MYVSVKLVAFGIITFLAVQCFILIGSVPLRDGVGAYVEHTTAALPLSNSNISIKIQESRTLLKAVNLGSGGTLYGECIPDNQRLHTEDIQIENEGPSQLSGVLEFYIDLPIEITCLEIWDKASSDSKSNPQLHAGGPGYNWFFVKVQGQYSKGMHILVSAFGIRKRSK